jgi:hypothetical protein
MSTKTSKNVVVNTGQYHKCFNQQILDPSALSTISATEIVKAFSDAKYRICAVDGNTYKMTLPIYKLWDLITIKLTELVPCHRRTKNYQWDHCDPWDINLSIKTIADCLGLSTSVGALTHLYDRIIAAANVLRNISVTVTKGKNSTKIDGYLSDIAVRDCSHTQKHSMTKSNALFSFTINPELIAYLAEQNLIIFHFNHAWLHLPENSLNAYVAAKRLGRHYSQNTYKCKNPAKPVTMDIGTLRNCLPCLNNKVDRDNRVALDNALKSIPGLTYSYLIDGQELTFEELAKRQLRSRKYNEVKIDIRYDDHPNTSDNKPTTDLIKKMNDDALYGGHCVYDVDAADTIINHKGAIKQPAEKPIYALPPMFDDDPEKVVVVDTVPPISTFSR